jgi:hypothetical protein
MGLKKGWPDFQLVVPGGRFHGLEMKRRGQRLSEEQAEVAAELRAAGAVHAVAHSFDKAVALLKRWGALPAGFRPQ